MKGVFFSFQTSVLINLIALNYMASGVEADGGVRG